MSGLLLASISSPTPPPCAPSSPVAAGRRHDPGSRPPGGPPLWEAAAAELVDPSLQWDPSAQPEPTYEFDLRIGW
jgi:hypothetical protein